MTDPAPAPAPAPAPTDTDPMQRLLAIMRRLRDPETGCTWDLQQTFGTIAPYTVEEAYEVADAIDRNDMVDLKEKLGDLLLQVVFHSQMAAEAGAFTFADVAESICAKMIRRHPNVFATANRHSAEDQVALWDAIKAQERAEKAAAKAALGQSTDDAPHSVLDGVSRTLPALARAEKLTRRAAQVGFDWGAVEPILAQLWDEVEELKAEIAARPQDSARLLDEMGDVLFVCANLARHLKLDPETALRSTNAKFERRFRRIEALLAAAGRSPEQASLEEMDALWSQAKQEERA